MILKKKNTKKKYSVLLYILILILFVGINGFAAEVTLDWEAIEQMDVAGYKIRYNSRYCCEPYDGTGIVEGNSPIDIQVGSPGFDPANPEKILTILPEVLPYYFTIKVYDTEGNESQNSNEVNTSAPQITSFPTVVYLTSNVATIKWITDQESNSEIRYSEDPDPWNSGSSISIIDNSFVTDHSITITGLDTKTIYYFQIGSANELGIGPDSYSDSIDNNPSTSSLFETESDEDTTPPQMIMSPVVTQITNSTAAIEWTTDEPATNIVSYGLTNSYGLTESDSTLNLKHLIVLNNLSPDTRYHFMVRSDDSSNNFTTSGDLEFVTEAVSDTEGPIFTSPPTITGLTNNSATIEWTTNELSNTQIKYDIESGFWGNYPIRVADQYDVIKHTITLTGLNSESTYYFRARSHDIAGNSSGPTDEYTFKTLADPDTTAPFISATPSVVSKTDKTSTIIWETDEPSNSQIQYSTIADQGWGEYESKKNDAELVAYHVMTLANLSEETTYYFRVGSTDSSGNGPVAGNTSNPSREVSFTTLKTPDTDAPRIISPPTITAKTDESFAIEWETDELSNSELQYGESTGAWGLYPKRYLDPNGVTIHRAVITGLDAETTYYIRVGSTDGSNNGPDTALEDINPSSEIIVVTDPDIDAKAPQIISPPTVTAKTDKMAVIEWSTDEPSNSIVQYALTSQEWGNYVLTESTSGMVADHIVTLTNLDVGQKYYFRVGSVDEHGNGPLASPEFFFTTETAPDNLAPRITIPPTVTGITDKAAIIEWETDEPSNSEIKYAPYSGSEPNLDWTDASLLVVTTSSMVTRHSVTLTNLSPSTNRYYFMIGSTDAVGNGPDPENLDSNNPFAQDFFSTEALLDNAAPKIISGPTVTGKDENSAIIEWETDEPSNSIVRYDTQDRTWFDFSQGIGGVTYIEECGIDGDGIEFCYDVIKVNTGSVESDAEMVTRHVVTITSLQPTTPYYYRVGSTDAFGNGPGLNQDATNPSVSGEFMTEEGPDASAPSITNLKTYFVTNITALITWETDEPSNSLIQYGIMSSDWDSYLFEEGDSGMVRNHSITITGLQPDTQYYFRAGSTDATGNGPWLNDRESNPSVETIFTSAIGPDVSAPQISNMRVLSVNDQTAVVEWVTDEPGNSQVRYDTASKQWMDYAYGENDAEMVTEHSVTITGLSPSTLYFLRVSSTDASGNNYGTSSSDTNPSNERNTSTSAANPPSIIIYPEADYPKTDPTNNTIEITYDEPNMQNAMVEANYIISPELTFATPGNSIRQIGSFGNKSTYRLSYASVPEYTIFLLMVWEEITDTDGYRVEPSTVLINDNDADDLPDDWEVAVGLDPTNADVEVGQGGDGDLDGDGYSNYDEFINQTDPTDSQNFPSPAAILQVLPHDYAGIEDDFRVANNSAFAVLIADSSGIDTTSETSIVFTVDDGTNDSYLIDLEDTDVFRMVQMNSDELDTAVTLLWAVYDRSRDDQYGVFPYENIVDVSVRVTNNLGNFEDGFYSFKIESEETHNQATDTNRIPEYSDLEADDLDFDDDVFTYDRGFQLAQDELSGTGAKLIYHSTDITPEFAPTGDLPLFDVSGANAIGIPLNLQPPTIFSVPVKLIMPIPDDSSVSDISIYLYDGENWVIGCDTSGNSDIPGWMVPGSRVNGNGRIELKIYHFSGLQTALLGEGTGGGSGGSRANGNALPEEEVGSCFITDMLGLKTGLW